MGNTGAIFLLLFDNYDTSPGLGPPVGSAIVSMTRNASGVFQMQRNAGAVYQPLRNGSARPTR